MLPSLVARDIEKGLRSYIGNEFPIASRGFCTESGKTVIEDFLERPEALVKGPWVEIKMPFRKEAEGELPFRALEMEKVIPGFSPYSHQRKAFDRLVGEAPLSTIIATGTGSGKTECFLLPILDYCLSLASREKPVPGIKAILIYPMNALATDQKKRVEELCKQIETVTGKSIHAGLYTGEADDMARIGFRANPPDILLTNYKMLDFLLLREEDQPLWAKNQPGVLKYLAVDELHTFDGAQGTDLACLIRRLRDRLLLGDSLACIGTSATIGSGPDSLGDLCQYASSVFGTQFTPDAVILEDRLSPAEYFASFGDVAPVGHWPGESEYAAMCSKDVANESEYFSKILPEWFDSTLDFSGAEITAEARVALAKRLPGLEGFRRLVADAADKVMPLDDLARKWAREIPEFRKLVSDPLECEAYARACVESVIAMVSAARSEQKVIESGIEKTKLRPFLTVRSQLWLRTITRAVVTVAKHPKLSLAADLASLRKPLALPLVSCRECNKAAWAASLSGGPGKSDVRVKPDLKLFYSSWFSGHRDTALLYPVTDEATYNAHRERCYRICPDCGSLLPTLRYSWEELEEAKPNDTRCRECGGENTLVVWIPDMTTILKDEDGTSRTVFQNKCPCCGSKGGLRIFGAAASTLLAAAADHLHSSRFNGDPKLIAFSDSVQDAAQRAGFLEARDFLPVCRHALVWYLKSRANNATDLKTLVTNFSKTLRQAFAVPYQGRGNEKTQGDAAFLATFMPPDKQWTHAWEVFSDAAEASCEKGHALDVSKLEETHDDWAALVDNVQQRLTWEALMELGTRSENGRTTLRTGHCAAFPDPERIAKAARLLAPALSEHDGIKTEQKRIEHFLAGVLRRFQLSGAFDATKLGQIGATAIEEDFGAFEEGKKNDFAAFNMSRVLPTFGKVYRAPNAVTFTPDKADRFNIAATATGRGRTWFEQWTLKSFGREDLRKNFELQNAFDPDDVLARAFEALDKAKLLKKLSRARKGSDIAAYVLPLETWTVTQDVRLWHCSCCGRRYFTAGGETASLWRGMPCFTPNCAGTLEAVEGWKPSRYYDSDPVRISAEEHTALVDDKTRAKIETNFGTVEEPWAVNLLSATPTLEMGIDIGSLSTVVLCSVPPGQSSYQQRIGRAGRRDGNAFALTMAGKSAHEQYYWQDPAEMLAGKIETPGVFLRAASVLERQLFAFALGRWVSGGNKAKLPRTLRDAISWHSSPIRAQRFPAVFLDWVQDHADELRSAFFALFDKKGEPEVLTKSVRTDLAHFLSPNCPGDPAHEKTLCARITSSLNIARAQFEDLQRKKKAIAKRIALIKKGPADDAGNVETAELEEQASAMSGLIKASFDAKLFFNFLTDEGLLPNYAFPEEGVQVHSIIVKRKKKDEGATKTGSKKERVTAFDFSRAAGPALRELAPESSFYANRHVLRVDQLAVSEGSFERWRFCPECGHAELASINPLADACPHCGNPYFGDSGRIKTLIRTRELTAVADGKRDRISDDREERRYEPMASHLLIDVDRKDVKSAWTLPKTAFGFEFLSRVTVREINFGPAAAGAAAPFRAGGINCPQTGFKLCRHCGKIWRRNYGGTENQPQKHDVSCPWYGKPDPEDPALSPWTEGLFLYREVKSEAIRIRIPVCDMIDGEAAETGTDSLIAAIRLGLRRYFRGSVDHLRIALQTEPAEPTRFVKTTETDSPATKRYIVIFDSIPGGSGYLKDLGDPKEMMAMLKEALSAVANCDCAKDPEKDGCPHCVYQYRDFSPREHISRSAAEKLLRRICSTDVDEIQTADTVSSIPAFDGSALEALFVERLSKIRTRVPEAEFTAAPGKTGEERWEISLPMSEAAREAFKTATGTDPGERFTWVLESQIDYEDATRWSRPDFLIAPASSKLAERFPALSSYVFTDGWEYHATIINEDAEKRQGIVNNGYRVWSLTWQDLAPLKPGSPEPEGYAHHLYGKQQDKNAERPWKMLGKKEGGATAAERRLLSNETNFDWLTAWMLDPFGFSADMRTAMEFAALAQPPQRLKPTDPQIPAPIATQLTGAEKCLVCADLKNRADFDFAGGVLLEPSGTIRITGAIRLTNAPFQEDPTLVKEDEKLHTLWAAFWQCANAIQFLERGWACTDECERAAPFENWYRPEAAKPDPVPALADDGLWRDAMEELEDDPEFFADVIPLAQKLRAAGAPAPSELGCDGAAGDVFSEPLGLAWGEEGGPRVFLFSAEHLFSALPEPGDARIQLFSTAEADWQERLLAALADMKDHEHE